MIATTWRYVRQVYRLGKDIFQRFPAETIRILGASAASLVCQVFALALLFVYLRALEGNTALLGLASRESPLLFTMVAVVTLLLLVAFSLLEYTTSTRILSLCRQYQNLGTEETLLLASKLPHWFAGTNGQHISVKHLRQILSVDVHHRSRMARVLMLAIIPAVRLALCAAALLYINLGFSALILFAVGIPVVGLYSVGRKVADTITIREAGAPNVFIKQRELLERCWEQGAPLAAADVEWELTLGQSESRYRQYFRRLRAKAYGTLLINTANTVGIMVLVVALGFWMMKAQESNWSYWLTYLIVLRYFLSSLRSTSQSVVTSTRFLRQSQRYSSFMDAATLALNRADPGQVPCPEHIARAYKGDGSATADDDEFDDD